MAIYWSPPCQIAADPLPPAKIMMIVDLAKHVHLNLPQPVVETDHQFSILISSGIFRLRKVSCCSESLVHAR